jgi:hypothetical protein
MMPEGIFIIGQIFPIPNLGDPDYFIVAYSFRKVSYGNASLLVPGNN